VTSVLPDAPQVPSHLFWQAYSFNWHLGDFDCIS